MEWAGDVSRHFVLIVIIMNFVEDAAYLVEEVHTAQFVNSQLWSYIYL